MRINTTKYTYEALLAYASHLGEQEFRATQDRLLFWFEHSYGLRMSRPTLSNHLHRLQNAGLFKITYTAKGQATYTFPDGVITRQRLEFLPASAPGVFEIKDAGTEPISGETQASQEPPMCVHHRVANSFSLDELPF